MLAIVQRNRRLLVIRILDYMTLHARHVAHNCRQNITRIPFLKPPAALILRWRGPSVVTWYRKWNVQYYFGCARLHAIAMGNEARLCNEHAWISKRTYQLRQLCIIITSKLRVSSERIPSSFWYSEIIGYSHTLCTDTQATASVKCYLVLYRALSSY